MIFSFFPEVTRYSLRTLRGLAVSFVNMSQEATSECTLYVEEITSLTDQSAEPGIIDIVDVDPKDSAR